MFQKLQSVVAAIKQCTRPNVKEDLPGNPFDAMGYNTLPVAVAIFTNTLECIYCNALFTDNIHHKCEHFLNIIDKEQMLDMVQTLAKSRTWQGTITIQDNQFIHGSSLEKSLDGGVQNEQHLSYKALCFIAKSCDGPEEYPTKSESDVFALLDAMKHGNNHPRISTENVKKQKVYHLLCCMDATAKTITAVAIDTTQRTNAESKLIHVLEAEHNILENLFPKHVLEYITKQRGSQYKNISRVLSGAHTLASRHDQVTVMFADIVGFTPMCSTMEPFLVMSFLNKLFSRFDALLDLYGVYKVETIGDCYVVAGGLISRNDTGMMEVRKDHDQLNAIKVVKFAAAIIQEARKVKLPGSNAHVNLRIGIHTGPLVSGIIGNRMPRFCMFGDTINTAARMEATATPGTIHASRQTRELTRSERWVYNGALQVKGKGTMHTYTLYPLLLREEKESASVSFERSRSQYEEITCILPSL